MLLQEEYNVRTNGIERLHKMRQNIRRSPDKILATYKAEVKDELGIDDAKHA